MANLLTCVFGLEQRCFEGGVDLGIFEMSRQAFVVSLDRYFCGFLHFVSIKCGSGVENCGEPPVFLKFWLYIYAFPLASAVS
jgi:hypothetical protein